MGSEEEARQNLRRFLAASDELVGAAVALRAEVATLKQEMAALAELGQLLLCAFDDVNRKRKTARARVGEQAQRVAEVGGELFDAIEKAASVWRQRRGG